MTFRLLLSTTCLVLSLFPSLVPAALAQSSSRFCAGVDVEELGRPYVFRYGLTRDQLQTDFFNQDTGLNGQGYRPKRLTGYRVENELRYATKWVQMAGPHWLGRSRLTGDEFHALYLERRAEYRPIDVTGYNTPTGGVRFGVIWERNVDGIDWEVHRNFSRSEMQDLVNEKEGTGWLPVRVEGYTLDGEPHYISIWVRDPCVWRMHNKMTRDQYQTRLDDYTGTFRLVHLDSYEDDGEVFYAGIWWQQPGPGQSVRSNRDWYLFQRFFNNNLCAGRRIDNFYAADLPGAIRYGGIWTFLAAPVFNARSSLASRIRQEIHCAPGRAGGAVINLTTGEQIMVHADAPYGTSSTIKSAILYALLRRIDATDETLDTQLNMGLQYGTNQGNTLTPFGLFTLRQLATTMIQNSNNWATNRLIDFIGPLLIRVELDSLGLDEIRLRRYMTGSGSPSMHGNDSSGEDYAEGFDNTATPRQYARFLSLVHANNGLLTPRSWAFFWNTLGLNQNAHATMLNAGVGTDWASLGTVAEKAGSNCWNNGTESKPQIDDHLQRSAAGRISFANGQVVVYAAFVDEADKAASCPATASVTPLQNMLDCVVMHAFRQYSGQTTGTDVAACTGG
jgi:Beta-lactamase enzyme family/Polyglycine hydrolase-like, structural repeat